MGGRGSGGGKGSAGASIKKQIDDELLQGNINYAKNNMYKYEDDAYDYKQQAASELAMAKKLEKAGKLKSAEKYRGYAEQSKAKQLEAEKKAQEHKAEYEKLTKKQAANFPKTYQYIGDKGYSRSVYKSPQKALEVWKQRKQSITSTAYADSPTIVKSPTGGYSVVPHKLVKLNKLTEISPYRIEKLND